MEERGRVAWVELNAQRAAAAVGFYRDLLGWEVRAMHHAPFGLLPVFVNGGERVGLAFTAMGAFAPARWLPWFVGDPGRAVAEAEAQGGRVEGEVVMIPGHGRVVSLRDPLGAVFGVIEPAFALPDRERPGGVFGAELWARGAAGTAGFYAAVLGIAAAEMGRGPGLWLRDVAWEVAPPRWVPCFRSVSVGGDGRRAEVLGAVPQAPVGDVAGLGRRGLWADPAGAVFALAGPEGA